MRLNGTSTVTAGDLRWFGSSIPVGSLDVFTLHSVANPQQPADFIDLTECAVKTWELSRDTNPNIHIRGRHRRRYGLAPQPHFMHGLGPWCVSPGERYSIQVKRAVSVVTIRRQPNEPELRLPISKRQLVASVSCEALYLDKKLITSTTPKTPVKGPVIFFWTPDYWYRPRSAKDAYSELLTHLRKVREYCQNKYKIQRKGGRRILFKKIKPKKQEKDYFQLDTEEPTEELHQKKKSKQRCRVTSLFRSNYESSEIGESETVQETSLQYLRRILRMEIALTAWDFDSTTLAHQLTLIDRDLFLKIPSIELGVIFWQQTSKNSPNIGALEAFSHRISGLVATEILRDDCDRIRARLISRLINTAEKCHTISNFQSCRSILSGLQSPAIYRLHLTWTHVRKRHATKYQTFETLCRLYRDPRLPAYQKAFVRASKAPPFLPYIGDIIAHLLNRITSTEDAASTVTPQQDSTGSSLPNSTLTTAQSSSSRGTFKKILSTLRVVTPPVNNSSKEYGHPVNHSEIESIDSRIIRLNKGIEMLESSQKAASSYILRKNDLAQEYLLKARYREDKENFLNSFGVEQPTYVNDRYICNY